MLDFFIRGIESAVADVFANRSTEQVRALQDDAEVRLIPCESAVAQIVAVDEDVSARGFVEARGEVDDGAFAATAGTNEGDGLARFHGEVEIFQHRFAIEVGEIDMAEFDSLDACGMTIGREFGRAVGLVPLLQSCQNFLAVTDARHGGEQAEHAFTRGLGALHLHENLGDLVDRIEKLSSIENERHQRAERQAAIDHAGPAAPQRDACGQTAEGEDDGNVDRGLQRVLDRCAIHLRGNPLEFVQVVLLTY